MYATFKHTYAMSKPVYANNQLSYETLNKTTIGTTFYFIPITNHSLPSQ